MMEKFKLALVVEKDFCMVFFFLHRTIVELWRFCTMDYNKSLH